MKLEIELDLNKIDYDEINKQIQNKIEEMDIEKTYQISSKISSKINEEIEKVVNTHICRQSWSSDLNDDNKKIVYDQVTIKISELVRPHVEKIFSQIPTDDLNKIISDLIPKILIDLLTNNVGSAFYNYCEASRDTTLQICEEKIRHILSR